MTALALTGAILIALIAVVAVPDRRDSVHRPSPATPSTATVTTVPPALPPTAVRLPPVDEIPDLRPATSASFPWGSAAGSVGIDPAPSGALGPPVATVDDSGKVQVFDQVNWRIVARASDGTSSTKPLDAPKQVVQGAVFDGNGLLIVAGSTDLMVFTPDGRLQGSYPLARFTSLAPAQGIHWLQVHGGDVVVNSDNTEWVVLADAGKGYVPQYSAQPSPAAVQIQGDANGHKTVRLTDAASGAAFEIGGPYAILFVPTVRRLPDESIVAVFTLYFGNDGAPTDTPQTFLLLRIRPDGTTQVGKFAASSGRLDITGPIAVADDNAVSVLSSTTTAGVIVARYRYLDLSAPYASTFPLSSPCVVNTFSPPSWPKSGMLASVSGADVPATARRFVAAELGIADVAAVGGLEVGNSGCAVHVRIGKLQGEVVFFINVSTQRYEVASFSLGEISGGSMQVADRHVDVVLDGDRHCTMCASWEMHIRYGDAVASVGPARSSHMTADLPSDPSVPGGYVFVARRADGSVEYASATTIRPGNFAAS